MNRLDSTSSTKHVGFMRIYNRKVGIARKTFNLITIPNIFVDKVSEQVSGFKMQEKSSGFDGLYAGNLIRTIGISTMQWSLPKVTNVSFVQGIPEWSSQRFFEAIPDGGPGPDHTKICRHLDVAIVGKVVFVFVVYDPS